MRLSTRSTTRSHSRRTRRRSTRDSTRVPALIEARLFTAGLRRRGRASAGRRRRWRARSSARSSATVRGPTPTQHRPRRRAPFRRGVPIHRDGDAFRDTDRHADADAQSDADTDAHGNADVEADAHAERHADDPRPPRARRRPSRRRQNPTLDAGTDRIPGRAHGVPCADGGHRLVAPTPMLERPLTASPYRHRPKARDRANQPGADCRRQPLHHCAPTSCSRCPRPASSATTRIPSDRSRPLRLSRPGLGTLSLNPDGSFTFDPDQTQLACAGVSRSTHRSGVRRNRRP